MERIDVSAIPKRDPTGHQEEIAWWYPMNGDRTVYVHDTKEGIAVQDDIREGETHEAVCRRILQEIGRLSLAIREKTSVSLGASGTMHQ